MRSLNEERILSVHHWTDSLFSFTASRNPGFRFACGQFTMLGLEVNGCPLLRAYSMASANYEETLEFFSIKVADGPLTSRLQRIKEGDIIFVGRKATGTLVQDNLLPGRTLFLLSTGTGIAPFVSIIKDPETYERFEKIVLVRGCRRVAELTYGEEIIKSLPNNEFFGDLVREKLIYYPTVTREPFQNSERITDLLSGGKLCEDLGRGPLEVVEDRLMLCGSPPMVADLRRLLEDRGFIEGSHSEPGHFVIEKAFVER